MENNVLVTVRVISYNSAKTIIDTLESIKNQTYNNIELVVSDDCSQDDTVMIVRKWIEKNRSRFYSAEVLTIDHNTGVPANLNRASKACHGKWLKGIAADDVLLPNCIADNLQFAESNPSIKWIVSDMYQFSNKGIVHNFARKHLNFYELDAEEQFKELIGGNCIPAPSCFMASDIISKFQYEEKYRGMEDHPMWLKLTRAGFKAYYLDKETVGYRSSEGESLSGSKKCFYNPSYMLSLISFFWAEQYPYIRKYGLQEAYDRYRRRILIYEFAEVFLKNKRSGLFSRAIFWLINKYLNHKKDFKM